MDIRTLRNATEDDVAAALDGALVGLPITNATDALEFFNRMVDQMTGESGNSPYEE